MQASGDEGSSASVRAGQAESGSLLGRTIDGVLSERDPATALRRLVSLQGQLIRASAALLLSGGAGTFQPSASWKEGQEIPVPPPWRDEAEALAAAAARERRSATESEPRRDRRGQGTLIAQPFIGADGKVEHAVVFELPSRSAAAIALARERLELAARSWAHWQALQAQNSGDANLALEILAGLAHEEGFQATAYSLCTRLAEALGARRVALATGSPGSLRLRGSSHSLVLERGGAETRWLERAMEFCAGQDLELFSPCHPNPSGGDARPPDPAILPLERLREECGAGPIAMTPIRVRGRVRGVLTVEGSEPGGEVASAARLLRLVGDLCAPWLIERERADLKGFERLRAWFEEARRELVRPKGMARRLAIAAAALAGIGLLIPVKYHVEAPFVVRAQERRVVTAPFDGRLRGAGLQPGEKVVAGRTVLAELDTQELELEWSRARSEYVQAQKRADAARNAGEPGDEQIALFEGERARAAMALFRTRIGQASILSPISGVVLAGDLRKRLGSPVSRGEVLLEVASLSTLEAEVSVPEDRLLSIIEGQRGWLVPAARPDVEVEVVVRRIDPRAEFTDQENAFPVWVELQGEIDELGVSILPGMRGVARIQAEPASWLWQWTREAVHYLRLHLWI